MKTQCNQKKEKKRKKPGVNGYHWPEETVHSVWLFNVLLSFLPGSCLNEFKYNYMSLVHLCYTVALQVALVVKNPPANAGDVRDTVLTPGLGRSPGGGNGNPLQYSCWENPMDRRTEEAGGLHSIGSQSQTRVKQLSTHATWPSRGFVRSFWTSSFTYADAQI